MASMTSRFRVLSVHQLCPLCTPTLSSLYTNAPLRNGCEFPDRVFTAVLELILRIEWCASRPISRGLVFSPRNAPFFREARAASPATRATPEECANPHISHTIRTAVMWATTYVGRTVQTVLTQLFCENAQYIRFACIFAWETPFPAPNTHTRHRQRLARAWATTQTRFYAERIGHGKLDFWSPRWCDGCEMETNREQELEHDRRPLHANHPHKALNNSRRAQYGTMEAAGWKCGFKGSVRWAGATTALGKCCTARGTAEPRDDFLFPGADIHMSYTGGLPSMPVIMRAWSGVAILACSEILNSTIVCVLFLAWGRSGVQGARTGGTSEMVRSSSDSRLCHSPQLCSALTTCRLVENATSTLSKRVQARTQLSIVPCGGKKILFFPLVSRHSARPALSFLASRLAAQRRQPPLSLIHTVHPTPLAGTGHRRALAAD